MYQWGETNREFLKLMTISQNFEPSFLPSPFQGAVFSSPILSPFVLKPLKYTFCFENGRDVFLYTEIRSPANFAFINLSTLSRYKHKPFYELLSRIRLLVACAVWWHKRHWRKDESYAFFLLWIVLHAYKDTWSEPIMIRNFWQKQNNLFWETYSGVSSLNRSNSRVCNAGCARKTSIVYKSIEFSTNMNLSNM